MKKIIGFILAALVPTISVAQSPGGLSQPYPSKPVRLVTPSAPGSTADSLGRLVAQKLTETWGQQVVVDARAGAAGIVASGIVAKAPPDGYTLIVVAGNHAINPSLYSKLPYDTERDFAPVTQLGAAPLLIAAHPSAPAATMRELIAYARANPGRLNYASAGKGTPSHLVMELLMSMAQLKFLHVPYTGGGPVLNAVVGGESHLLASGVLILVPLVKAGKLKAMAVTGPKRAPIVSDVPTVAESGVPGFAVTGWWGLLAPGATPKPIVSRVQRDVAASLATPEVQSRLAGHGIEPVGSSPEQFSAYIKSEITRWSRVVKDAGIRPD